MRWPLATRGLTGPGMWLVGLRGEFQMNLNWNSHTWLVVLNSRDLDPRFS